MPVNGLECPRNDFDRKVIPGFEWLYYRPLWVNVGGFCGGSWDFVVPIRVIWLKKA